MAVDPRVQERLDELCDSGCTPEQVCAACPELLPEVRRRWLEMRALKADLDALFPTPGPDPAPGADTSVPWHTGDELPKIPGYEVAALIGRGCMGLVSNARHLRLNRYVALKMLITGAYAGPHDRARFQREAAAIAGLQHASIVQVHDVRDHEGWPYFTMELLEGGSLAQSLLDTPQPARQAAALVATLIWLDQFRDGIPAQAENELELHYHNWLEAHVLRREAEALIPSTGPRSGPENREPGAARK